MAYRVFIAGVDTSRLPKLSKADSARYLEEIASGDNTHREYFLTANLRLVLSIVHRFNYDPSLTDDVFQVGCLGLVKALNNFDPKHQVMFSTYAVPMIIGEIRRYLRETNGIKVSRSLRDTAYRIMQAKEQMAIEDRPDPTFAEIAQYLGVEEAEIACAMDAMADPVSLDEPAYMDGDESALLKDQIADPTVKEDKWVDYLSLNNALSALPPKERQVIKYRYYDGKTQTEISALTGVSQAQVSRIESSALSHLKAAMIQST